MRLLFIQIGKSREISGEHLMGQKDKREPVKRCGMTWRVRLALATGANYLYKAADAGHSSTLDQQQTG